MPLSPAIAALRDGAFFALNRIPPVRRFLGRGGFHPPTRLAPSVLVNRRREPLAGTILPHAVPAPGSLALDAIWGCHQWLALGLGGDPQALLPAADRARLATLGACFAAVNAARLAPGTTRLETTDEHFLSWMHRHGAGGVLVRPDRFIAGTLAPGQTPGCLALFSPSAAITALALGEAA
jgi:hypothetical protein